MYRYECIMYYEYKPAKKLQLHERKKSDQEVEDLLGSLKDVVRHCLRDKDATITVGPSDARPQARKVAFETRFDRAATLSALAGLPAGLYTERLDPL
jgi:hypothetical protein